MNNPDKLIILKDLKQILSEKKISVDRVILFGSRSTGMEQENSDYDVLLILQNEFDWKLENSILDLCNEINLKYDILLDVKIFSRDQLDNQRGKQPFVIEALAHGLVV